MNLLNKLSASIWSALSSSPNGHGYPYGGKLFLSDELRRPDAYAAWIWDKTSYLCERTPEAHVQESLPLLHGPKKLLQSNLDYPDLDYPDFSIIRTFSLVPIL